MRIPSSRPATVLLYSGLGAALFGVVLLGLATGPVAISLTDLLASLRTPLHLGYSHGDAAITQTLLQLRLPRVVLGVLVGAALAVSGATMQGVFRNPLAEPGLVGVSSGAALAAVAVIVLGRSVPGNSFGSLPMTLALPLATFTGAALACALVMRLARIDGVTHSATLLLAGLAINAIAGGAIGLLSYVAADDALRTATYWMFGSLGRAGWEQIAVVAPVLLMCIVLLPRAAAALNVLQLGEAEAGYLGIDVEQLKRRLLFGVLLAVGGSVALAGAIGFVGLIAPQLVRLIVGPDQRRLMPAAALLGASLLTLADWVARTVAAPADLPIGILTALIGGPFFLMLLLRLRGDGSTVGHGT